MDFPPLATQAEIADLIAELGQDVQICMQTTIPANPALGIPARQENVCHSVRGYVLPMGYKEIGVNFNGTLQTGDFKFYVLNDDFDPDRDLTANVRVLWRNQLYQLVYVESAVSRGIKMLHTFQLFARGSANAPIPRT